MNVAEIRLVFTAAFFAAIVSFLPGCNSGGGPELDAAKAESDRLATELRAVQSDVEKLRDENRKLELSKLKSANEQMKEQFASDGKRQQELTRLETENRRLGGQVETLQRSLTDVKEELVSASRKNSRSAARAGGAESVKKAAESLVVQLKPLPEKIDEDGLECKECTNAKLGTLKNGRLISCVGEMCDQGFLRRRVSKVPGGKTKIQVRFPCPTCLGMTRIPCGTCRKKDYEFGMAQQNVIAGYLKQGKILWIESLGVSRELNGARGRLRTAISDDDTSGRRSSESQIRMYTQRFEKLQKKYLENNYAIVAVFRQQLELCLRNVPRKEQPSLRSKAITAIDLFSAAYNKGYYY